MRLLNENEAAALLNCSIHKLQKDRRTGSDLPFLKVGRSVRYDLSDVEAYIESRKFTSTSQYQGGCDE